MCVRQFPASSTPSFAVGQKLPQSQAPVPWRTPQRAQPKEPEPLTVKPCELRPAQEPLSEQRQRQRLGPAPERHESAQALEALRPEWRQEQAQRDESASEQE